MLTGESITILRPRITGIDEYGEPTRQWDEETIDDTLVGPPTPTEATDSTTPDAIDVTATLYLPRNHPVDSLNGCKAIVRSHEYRIIGDPIPLDAGITPTRWNMSVHITRDDGR